MKTIVSASLAGATLLGVAARAQADALVQTLPTYTATYEAQYKGKNLGSSEFKVTHDTAKNIYEFMSTTTAKGILGKLAAPNPTIERSIFTVVGGKVRPSEYWYKDGTRKADGDKHIQFDWDRHVATVSDKDGRREVSLDDLSVDAGSLHVALMQDLIQNGKPGQYRIADSEQAKTYGFDDNGEAQIDTGLGKLDTHCYIQHREGSSRKTYLWVAPQLDYLPARIETRKDDEVQTALTLMSVEGIEKR
jgi:uncharacterized protein DUF3108